MYAMLNAPSAVIESGNHLAKKRPSIDSGPVIPMRRDPVSTIARVNVRWGCSRPRRRNSPPIPYAKSIPTTTGTTLASVCQRSGSGPAMKIRRFQKSVMARIAVSPASSTSRPFTMWVPVDSTSVASATWYAICFRWEMARPTSSNATPRTAVAPAAISDDSGVTSSRSVAKRSLSDGVNAETMLMIPTSETASPSSRALDLLFTPRGYRENTAKGRAQERGNVGCSRPPG